MAFSTRVAHFFQLSLLIAICLFSGKVLAQPAAPSWGRIIRSASAAASGYHPTRLAVAPDGSQYVSGVFNTSFTVGGTTYSTDFGGLRAIFLAKFSPNGTLQWFKRGQIGTPWSISDCAPDVALDATGNVYFAGYIPVALDFGNGFVLRSAGTSDAYVLKFDAQGTLLWSRTAGATSGVGTGAGASRLTIDAAGNVLVAGWFKGSISFGGPTAYAVDPDGDLFLAKLDANGVAQWVRSAGSINNAFVLDRITGVEVDATGNAYVAGAINGTATFGSVTLNPIGAPLLSDMFLVKYSPQGIVLWARRSGSADDDALNGLAVDAAGYAVVCGWSDGGMVNSTYQQNIYTARYSPQGVLLWERRVVASPAAEVEAQAVTYDGLGGIYVTGSSAGQLTFGATTLQTPSTGFVVRYDLQGNAVWADQMTGSLIPREVSVDATGTVYLAGEASRNVYMGSTFSPSSTTIGSLFVAQLTAAGPLATTAARHAQPLSVFPNPAREFATLQLPAGCGRLVVFDALGRAVREQPLPAVAGPCRVELSGLAPGLYHLQATLAGGQLASASLLLR